MNTEKFEWFVSLMLEGQKVKINPYELGDFLKFVSMNPERKELFEREYEREDVEDEDDLFPVIPMVWLKNHVSLEM